MSKIVAIVIAAQILLFGCSRSSQSPNSGSSGAGEVETDSAPQSRILPTLYPTATQHPTPRPTDTRQPDPTLPPDTPVAYDQVVVDLRFSIPAIGLARSLTGDVSGRLKLVDETTGRVAERRNQVGILLEMQQSLPGIELDELPEDCDHCFWLEYSLPLTGDRDQGWLQDVRMLASVENFTSAVIGPHFPPGTVAGLRRSATQDQVAHTVALTSDGLLWRWRATEAEIPVATTVENDDPILSTVPSNKALADLAPLYAAACPDRAGVETLFVRAGDTERFIDLFCPELALPATLLPIYLSLDAKTVGIMEDTNQEVYDPPLDQETLLYYKNDDGFELTVFYDGQTFAGHESGIILSDTITVTLALSLTTDLLESEVMQLGVENFLEGTGANILVVRGPYGLYEQVWEGQADPRIEAVVEQLDGLIIRLMTTGEDLDTDEGDPSNLETPFATTPSAGTPIPQITPMPG